MATFPLEIDTRAPEVKRVMPRTTRERKECFAMTYDGVRGLDWRESVDRFLSRQGISWLTDEQVEEITSDMVSHARFSQRLRVRNRNARRSAA